SKKPVSHSVRHFQRRSRDLESLGVYTGPSKYSRDVGQKGKVTDQLYWAGLRANYPRRKALDLITKVWINLCIRFRKKTTIWPTPTPAQGPEVCTVDRALLGFRECPQEDK
ncbi:2706_t:CDS:2, partial [Acaulospora colombiana]